MVLEGTNREWNESGGLSVEERLGVGFTVGGVEVV